MSRSRYRFQFETGHLYDGSTEITINNFIGEVEGEINKSLAQTIEAHGGVLVEDIENEPKPKKRKAKPVNGPKKKVRDDGTSP